jgi:hypothetical protein
MDNGYWLTFIGFQVFNRFDQEHRKGNIAADNTGTNRIANAWYISFYINLEKRISRAKKVPSFQ